jgi:hypothetical protein
MYRVNALTKEWLKRNGMVWNFRRDYGPTAVWHTGKYPPTYPRQALVHIYYRGLRARRQ